MKALYWFLVVTGQVYFALSSERKSLTKEIYHYEPLDYPESDIKESFKSGIEMKSLDFKAHGRDFKLRLQPDRETFLPGLQGLNDETKDHINSALAGYLEDEPNSEAFGAIKNGKFEGTIFTNDEEYTVRPAEMYFDEPQDFHSVVYRSKDVDESVRRRRNIMPSMGDEPRSKRRRRETNEFDEPDTFDLYTQRENKNLKVCNISMEADYLFTEAWGNDTGRVIGEMIYLVRLANRRFEDMAKTELWREAKMYTVRLMIGHIMAYTYETTPDELKPESMGVSTFLDFVSDRDYDGYCQAFFFTYRDFEGGITGLSWGAAEGGGICEARRYFIRIYENFNVQKLKSYNSGVVTYKFYGKLVPPKIGEIAFLRQVGTAFGAPNDPDTKECQPDIEDGGNYVMYDGASNGGRKNNDQFSPCSIRAIIETLKSSRPTRPLQKDRSGNFELKCIEVPEKIIDRRPKCGDTVMQNHEQCDCGTPAECKLSDPGGCCDPKTCRLRPGAYCSAVDGPCCDPMTCSHRSADYICRPGDECAFAARCRNLRGFANFQCPGRVKKGDFKPCEVESQVCLDGICSNSVCRRYGLTECQCSQKEFHCYVCCNFLGMCVPALHIPQVTGFRNPTLPVGAPCANDTGFCDLFHECDIVDFKTPIENIQELYFKREDAKVITRKYWWAILLGTFVWICFIIILIFLVNKRTRSSIPKRDPRQHEMSLLQTNGHGR